jgi:hypothetical protein
LKSSIGLNKGLKPLACESYFYKMTYAMLIGTNWAYLILGKIIWGLALSRGLK